MNASELFNLIHAQTKLESLYEQACYQHYLWSILKTIYEVSIDGETEAIFDGECFPMPYYMSSPAEEKAGFQRAIEQLEKEGYRIVFNEEDDIFAIYWEQIDTICKTWEETHNFDDVEEF